MVTRTHAPTTFTLSFIFKDTIHLQCSYETFIELHKEVLKSPIGIKPGTSENHVNLNCLIFIWKILLLHRHCQNNVLEFEQAISVSTKMSDKHDCIENVDLYFVDVIY